MTLKRSELLHQTVLKLEDVKVENTRFEAEGLIKLALETDESLILSADELVTPEQIKTLDKLLDQRINNRKPLSRIRGYKDFWKHRFLINEHVLDPRADSEVLVEAALDFLRDIPTPQVLDLGTGSGCLLLSILDEQPDAKGLGVDISQEALRVANANAKALALTGRCTFQQGTWGDGLDQRFDLIVCNPPYIDPADKSWMSAEVLHHDPEISLFAKNQGLADYETIFQQLPKLLKSRGIALFEHGFDQREALLGLANRHRLIVHCELDDLAGQPRCLGISH